MLRDDLSWRWSGWKCLLGGSFGQIWTLNPNPALTSHNRKHVRPSVISAINALRYNTCVMRLRARVSWWLTGWFICLTHLSECFERKLVWPRQGSAVLLTFTFYSPQEHNSPSSDRSGVSAFPQTSLWMLTSGQELCYTIELFSLFKKSHSVYWAAKSRPLPFKYQTMNECVGQILFI